MRLDHTRPDDVAGLRRQTAAILASQLISMFPAPAGGEAPTARFECWLRQILRRRPELPVPLLNALALAMARTLADSHARATLPETRHTLRWVARIANRDQDTVTVQSLLSALRQSPDRWQTEIRAVDREARARHDARLAAAARGGELAVAIEQFVSYMSAATGYRPVPIRFDARELGRSADKGKSLARAEITAMAGSQIHLPDAVAATPYPDLNAAFLTCYLPAHEFLHLAAGSFQFCFRSRRGRYLYRLLRANRGLAREREDATGAISATVQNKLAVEGLRTEALKLKRPPDLVRFFWHFVHRDLAQWLYNALEDGRLESIMGRRWPGLVQLHRAIGSIYARQVTRSPVASTITENLITAVGMYAAQRTALVILTPLSRPYFQKAKRIIDEYRRREPLSAYDSARTTIRLYGLLERWLVETGADANDLAAFRLPVDLEEVLIRLALSEKSPDDAGISSQGPPRADAEFRIERPGMWVDEWYLDERLERRVYVTRRLFQPSRPYPLPPHLQSVFPDLGLARRLAARANGRHWSTDGDRISDDRLADWRAERRAGVSEATGMFFELRRATATLDVTLLFDLSISMEARRWCLNGESAMERAIQAGSWLAEQLESQAVEVHAFGGIDGGIHDVQLLELPRPTARSIRSLRCQGAGGFRLGPLLRAIAQTQVTSPADARQRRHLTIVLTDGEPGYLSTAAERLFTNLHRANCPNCTQRRQCLIERARGTLDTATGPAPQIFQNQQVALGDIQRAVKEVEHVGGTSVHMLVFNDQVDESLWNARLGETGWSRVLNITDLHGFSHWLLNWLRPR